MNALPRNFLIGIRFRKPYNLHTTEHVIACITRRWSGAGDVAVTVQNLENGENMKSIVELFKIAEKKRKN